MSEFKVGEKARIVKILFGNICFIICWMPQMTNLRICEV
jgi:hypothetical protein